MITKLLNAYLTKLIKVCIKMIFNFLKKGKDAKKYRFCIFTLKTMANG